MPWPINFRPDKNYQYNSSQDYWEETTAESVTCPKSKGDIDDTAVYKGSCLNFLYMRRIDLLRWAMTGGRPASCDDSYAFNNGYCDPALWNEPGNATKVGSVCNDTIGGCILQTTGSLKVKVPWSRIYDALAYQFQALSLKPRMGVMFYSSSGVRNLGKVYLGDFTAPNSTDDRFPYTNLITAFNSSAPAGGTPTGPAMWDAFNYFRQTAPQYGGLAVQSGSGDRWKNPMYVCDRGGTNCLFVPCAKNFVMLMSDGQWNNAGGSRVCSIDIEGADPVIPAYEMHMGFTNAKTGIQTDINAVHTIGLFLGGTGEQSLKNVAMYGSFTKTNTWPDSLTGYPSGTCYMDDCGNGKGSGCTPLPSSTSDWDTNGDNKPDTFHAATNATEIKDSIKNAILDMLRRASSGTAVSVLSSSEGSGANLIQALFYPRRVFSSTEISWVSDVMNYWYYMDPFFTYSQIREDTVRDDSAYTLLNLTNDYIVQFAFDPTQNKTMAHRWQDTDGNGSPDVDMGSVPVEEAKALWRAGVQLWKTSPAAGYRPTPQTTIDGSTLIYFNTSNVSALMPYLGVTDTTRAKKIINYVKGYDCADASGNPSEPTSPCSDPGNACCPAGSAPIGRNRTVTMNGETHVWKLGDVIHSTPRIMGPSPLNNYHLSAPVGYNDQTYYDFITSNDYKNKKRVFVGANDGMLHAFHLGKLEQGGSQIAKLSGPETEIGRETWAFIPKNALPYLQFLPVQDYCHVYIVDGPITLFDATINGNSNDPKTVNSWRTVMIGSMGIGGGTTKKTCNGTANGQICDNDSDCNGGQQCKNPDTDYRVGIPVLDNNTPVGMSSYFAFDVTNQDSPQLLWEFSDEGLGVSNPGAAIVKVGGKDKRCSISNNTCSTDSDCGQTGGQCVYTNGKWFAVLASGPTGPITAQEFQGKSNQNLKLFILDLKTGALVRTIDTGITNAFAGSLSSGPVDLEKNNPMAAGNYQDDVVYIGYVQNTTSGGVLRLVIDDNLDPNSWTVSKVIDNIGPVTTSVVNLLDRKNGKLWLFFGEGRYYHKSDDLNTQRRLFGIQEPCFSSASPNVALGCSSSLSLSDLKNQTSTPGALTTEKGWYINLDAATTASGAERMISNPTATPSGAVHFLTFAPTSDICGFGGTTYLWAVDYKTGGTVSYAMQGKALIQVSTGEIKEIDLSQASSFPDRDHRRSEGISGLPPQGQGMMIITNPTPIRKFMHVQER